MALLQQGARLGAAKLWYDRSKKRFYLLVALSIETLDPTPETHTRVVGVDVGQRYLATVATLDHGTQFYSGKQVRNQADHYARLQTRLQRKGTRSATRRRIAIGQRERQLKLNTNHTISKHILDTHPHSFIGVEDLTGIRDRTKAQTWQEGQPEATTSEPAEKQMGFCRVARLPGLQSDPGWFALCEGGCRLHQSGLPPLRLYQQGEPPQQRLALCVPVLPVHPPCRLDWGPEYQRTSARHPASLDDDGAVVRCPRCDGP